MSMIENEKENLCGFEQKMISGKRVMLLDSADSEIIRLLMLGVKKRGIRDMDIWYCNNSMSDDQELVNLSDKEMKELLEMYYVYDFSDKIIAFMESVQYGSMFNYNKTGILTRQEIVDALLYNI